jgi:cyclophilin family peptidyl-prolyl cis-trans isomerase/HEAT repeat protein
MREPDVFNRAEVDMRNGRMRRACVIGLLAVAAACKTVPTAQPVRGGAVIPLEQKMTWMLQLEDQRILKLPEPPPPAEPTPPPKGRRPAAQPVTPPVAAADLLKLATDAEPRVRRRAAVAIGRVGLKEGVPALTPLLADTDRDVRQAAAFALGLIGDASASSALLPLLADPDPMVRGRAAEAVGLLAAQAPDSGVGSLAQSAASAVSKMAAEYARSAEVTAMEPDGERWPAAPEAEAFKLGIFALVRLRAYDALAAAVLDQSGRPVSNWWPVAYALHRVNDPRAAPPLKLLAQVKGRYTPAFAARGLGGAKDPSAGDLLVTMIDTTSRPREVVASAIRAIAQLGVPQAGGKLAALASDPKMEPNLRLEAVGALGTLKATEQLPYVQDLITDEWPAMRAAALRAAAAIDPDVFTLTLSGLETDRHWLGRAALAETLATLRPEVANERLITMLQDEDRRVIPSVLRALVRVKAPGVDNILLTYLKEADYAVREAAASLLADLKPQGGLAALREAYTAALPDSAYGARAAAMEAVAAYGGAEAIEGVRPALTDKDWAVRVRAAELLTKLEPASDHRLEIRPAPGTAAAPYDDPQLTAPPYSPHAFIETTKGTIEFELAVIDAPQTTRNFMALVRKGFFNGFEVHRVVANFVVQDGDPRGDGEGGPGYTIRDELNERPYLRGTVGMALSWRDTGGSQFFITHSPQPHLDARYTAFGHVVNGMDVVDRIQVGDVIQRIRVWDGKGWQ